MAVAFSIAMRIERLAARNYLNESRAEQMIHVALSRAMEGVSLSTRSRTYTDFRRHPSDAGNVHEDYAYNPVSGSDSISNAFRSWSLLAAATNPCTDLLRGEATNFIPKFAWADALATSADCEWLPIYNRPYADTQTKVGEVAWIAVDSGFGLDANTIGGGTPPTVSDVKTALSQIDLNGINDFTSPDTFLADRTNNHKRFETIMELKALNPSSIGNPSNLFVYSFDPSRDFYFPNRTYFGEASFLVPKFNINSITNFNYDSDRVDKYWRNDDGSANLDFKNQYWVPLDYVYYNKVRDPSVPNMGWKYIYWQLINWLDPDCVPNGPFGVAQCQDKNAPVCRGFTPDYGSNWGWEEPGLQGASTHYGLGEATPLINEFVYTNVSDAVAGHSNHYDIACEVWFPFTGTNSGGYDYELELCAYDFFPSSNSASLTTAVEFRNLNNHKWRVVQTLPTMAYGGDDEFNVTWLSESTTPPSSPFNKYISFPHYTNGATEYWPANFVNDPAYVAGGEGSLATVVAPAIDKYGMAALSTNTGWVWPYAWIWQDATSRGKGGDKLIVDSAIGGYWSGSGVAGWANVNGTEFWPNRHAVWCFKKPGVVWAVDPRANWELGGYDDPNNNTRWSFSDGFTHATMGAVNAITNEWTDPYGPGRCGYPQYIGNRTMESVIEMCFLNCQEKSSLAAIQEGAPIWGWNDAVYVPLWCDFDLTTKNEGVGLLDYFTVRDTNRMWPTNGVVALNTPNRETIKALLYNMRVPTNMSGLTTSNAVEETKVDALVDEIMAARGTNGFVSWYDMFADPNYDNALRLAFRECMPEGVQSNNIHTHIALRNMAELVSFRQNIFTLIIAARVFGPDGASVVAEKRAVAVVYRDSYTSAFFIRQFKWLND